VSVNDFVGFPRLSLSKDHRGLTKFNADNPEDFVRAASNRQPPSFFPGGRLLDDLNLIGGLSHLPQIAAGR
jgi:hypothetical protein